MTPDRLRRHLDVLGWSSTALAERLGVSPVTVRRWLTGTRLVPQNVADKIEAVTAAVLRLSDRD